MSETTNTHTLNRALGPTTAILLVISSMIGSGIFKKIAPMSVALQDGNLILLAWLIAGIISMFGVFTYSGLASLTEEGGGQFEYFRIMFGDLFGFVFGWACFTVIQTASIASIAYVFSESVNNILHFGKPLDAYADVRFAGMYLFANSGIKSFAIATIIILTVVNILGVKKGGLINDIFSAAKIAGILLLIVLGFALSGAQQVQEESSIELVVPHGVMLISAMFTAMLSAFWAYDGWINISYIGGEVKDPKRNIPIAIIGGTAVVVVLYLLVNSAFLRTMGPAQFIEVQSAGDQIAGAAVAKALMGESGFILLSILVILCTFGATNASLMSSPRIYHQMAKKNLFFPAFAKVNGRFRTPHVSLLLQMTWAIILVISGTFDQLTDMLIFASFIFYGSGAIGLIYMKRKGLITKRVPGYPVIPVTFILFCIVLVANSFYSAGNRRVSLIGLCFILSAIPLYYLLKRKTRRT